MSISQLFPTSRPSLNLNFARSKTLDPRITFTRSSTGTYVGSDGLIKIATADQPRFDHDPVTGESLGLLVEEQRTNLVTDSATDYNYAFANQISSTALDIAPDGNNVLCKHDLSGSTEPFLNCNVDTSLTAGTYTMSMWLKGTTSFSASFAFVGETISEIYSNTADITTSWKRFTLTFTLINTQTASRLQVFFASQGEGKIISVWGAQLESGSFATSYIPRSSGQQSTRTADYPRMTGTNFSSWFNSSEGTLYSELFFKGGVGGSEFPNILNADASKYIGPYYDNNSNTVYFDYYNLSGNYVAIGSTSLSKNTFHKNATAYKSQDFAAAANGSIVGTSSSTATLATDFNRLLLGYYDGDNYYINGCIKSCTYYPTRLPNDQLQNLTK